MSAERQLGLLWGGVAVLLIALAPLGSSFAGQMPACPLKIVAEIPCPTCGATRSALALARFDLAAALKLNPLVTLAWAALIGGGALAGGLALAGRPLREPRWDWPLGVRLAIVSVVLANWAYVVWAGT